MLESSMVQCLDCGEVFYEDEIIDSVNGQVCPYCGEESSFVVVEEDTLE